MNRKFLIDMGSSTIKIYEYSNECVKLIEQKTLFLNRNFSKESGISQQNKEALIAYFQRLIQDYGFNNGNVKIYATGIFREINNPQLFIQWFFEHTGLYFNIISHDLEAFYLKKIWVNINPVGKMLVINIGGKTTEILCCENGQIIGEPQKIMIGVGTVLENYKQINGQICTYDYSEILKKIEAEVKRYIGKLSDTYKVALYTGGELNYMKKAGYSLSPNTLFDNVSHPVMISKSQYRKRNIEIFSQIGMDELRAMMPENPSWMEGARACSILADAIFEFFGVENIVPSDSNLIDGVACQETEKVVICGSFNKYLSQITELIEELKNKGIMVLSPQSTEVASVQGDFVIFKDDVVENHNTWAVEKLHLNAIDKSDYVIACNFDNYIGVSTTFELEYAYRKGKKIVFLKDNAIAHNFGDRIDVAEMPCEIGLL